VFGFSVEGNAFSNVSHDTLTLLIINTFLKDKMTEEVRKIIWNTSQAYKGKIEFPIDAVLADDFKAVFSDADWVLDELPDSRALITQLDRKPLEQNPVLACEKMIFLFSALRDYFLETQKTI
jgi:hypothetical protein